MVIPHLLNQPATAEQSAAMHVNDTHTLTLNMAEKLNVSDKRFTFLQTLVLLHSNNNNNEREREQ